LAEPTVSVLLPVHNGAAYLRTALDSALAQEGVAFEVLVVDDGSTDDSVAVAESLDDPRVVVVRKPNGGISSALNRGADEARGRYLARLDADDACLPDRFRLQARLLDSDPGLVIVGSAFDVIDADGATVDHRIVPLSDLALRASVLTQSPYCHGSVMMRRTAFEAAGRYRTEAEPGEDFDLWARLAALGSFGALAESLYAYRQHPGQISAYREAAQEASARRLRPYLDALPLPDTDRRALREDLAAHAAVSAGHAALWRHALREAALVWVRRGERRLGLTAASVAAEPAGGLPRFVGRFGKALLTSVR
jgi:glycosyltransferase involved in cell wall biosynthesis